tara:strand:- start:8075 stop:8569 length:495 start_codon:yes stop_codon:yes gene_type:complete
MAKTLRYGRGETQVEIDGAIESMVKYTLKSVAPMTMHILESEIKERVKHAKKNWIVRGDVERTRKNGTKYTYKQKSDRSIDKFKTGVRLLDGGRTIEAFYSNTAPYAWVIKAGKQSKKEDGSASSVKPGQYVARETMFKASKAGVDKLIKKLADAYIKDQRKVK